MATFREYNQLLKSHQDKQDSQAAIEEILRRTEKALKFIVQYHSLNQSIDDIDLQNLLKSIKNQAGSQELSSVIRNSRL
jgi:DNA-binding TFAR19-related protein (PDSD5 family)